MAGSNDTAQAEILRELSSPSASNQGHCTAEKHLDPEDRMSHYLTYIVQMPRFDATGGKTDTKAVVAREGFVKIASTVGVNCGGLGKGATCNSNMSASTRSAQETGIRTSPINRVVSYFISALWIYDAASFPVRTPDYWYQAHNPAPVNTVKLGSKLSSTRGVSYTSTVYGLFPFLAEPWSNYWPATD